VNDLRYNCPVDQNGDLTEESEKYWKANGFTGSSISNEKKLKTVIVDSLTQSNWATSQLSFDTVYT
jgi:hypothetical protein